MRAYYSKSWSEQAREMCEKQIQLIKAGKITTSEAVKFFTESYRAPIIRYRAVKRFGRKIRQNKI